MHRVRAFVDRIGAAWRTGRRVKLAVGCGSLITLWLLCSVCSAILRLSPASPQAAIPTATVSVALAIAPGGAPATATTRINAPTNAPPATIPPTAVAALPTTTPPRPSAPPPPVATSTTAPPTSAPPTPSPIPAETPAGPGWPAGTVRATLASIVDGDTIKVTIDGRSETIRLIGIDTPETVDPRAGVQCFGREASNYAKETLRPGAVVGLEADPSQGERDKYNRLLRYVWLEDGALFNLQTIAAGYAHEYTYDLPYKYQSQFKAAERQAREAEIGLWSPTTCGGNTEQVADAPGQPAPPAQPGVVAPAPQPQPPAPPPAPVTGGDALSISVSNPPNASEYVTVTNTGAEPVPLGGWRILSYSNQCTLQAEQTFTFPSGYTLAPGASVNVYSGFGASPPADGFKFNPQPIWANDGDRAELARPDGSIVARHSYGRCR